MSTGEPKWWTDTQSVEAFGRIEIGPSASTSFYTYPALELVRTKQAARERIVAALADDQRFAHWKKKEVVQLIDKLVEALSQTDVSLT